MYYKKKDTDGGKKKKKRTTSMRTLINKLDIVFSKFIRLRDAMPNGTFRCISCGQVKPLSQADCGHYHSRIHMSTRFDEDNCNAECRYCNRMSADHLIGYRQNLIRKIGENRLNMLDVRAHGVKKWSHFEIEQLIKYYGARVEMLEHEKGLKL